MIQRKIKTNIKLLSFYAAKKTICLLKTLPTGKVVYLLDISARQGKDLINIGVMAEDRRYPLVAPVGEKTIPIGLSDCSYQGGSEQAIAYAKGVNKENFFQRYFFKFLSFNNSTILLTSCALLLSQARIASLVLTRMISFKPIAATS